MIQLEKVHTAETQVVLTMINSFTAGKPLFPLRSFDLLSLLYLASQYDQSFALPVILSVY